MVRPGFVDQNGMRKGAWSKDEDDKLRAYVLRYGHWNWRLLPKYAGLTRCGKSCRLRWMNYLKPGLKRGELSKEEEDLIMELHNQLGNKWSAIAAKLPGRTDNEIKNYWHTHAKRHNQRKKNHVTKVRAAKASTENSPSDHQIQTLIEPQNLIPSPNISNLTLLNWIPSPNPYDTIYNIKLDPISKSISLDFSTWSETSPPINTYNSQTNIVPDPNESSSELNFSDLSFEDFPILSAFDWVGDDSVNSSDCNLLMENFWNDVDEANYGLPSVEDGGFFSAPYSSSFDDFMMDMQKQEDSWVLYV